VNDDPALVLFVAGNSTKAMAAAANLRKALRDLHLSLLALETVDVYDEPERALRARIFVTPTLLAAACSLRIVGDLSDAGQLIYFLRSVSERRLS
jgi:KaiB-like protein